MSKTRWVLLALAALFLASFAAWWQEQHPAWAAWQERYNAQPNVTPVAIGIKTLLPTSTGKPELCMTCQVGS